eukprot:1160791-Pelagomonas_calceolata.AAC.7
MVGTSSAYSPVFRIYVQGMHSGQHAETAPAGRFNMVGASPAPSPAQQHCSTAPLALTLFQSRENATVTWAMLNPKNRGTCQWHGPCLLQQHRGNACH